MKVSLASLIAITMMVMTGCVGLSKVKMSDADRVQVKTIKVRADNPLPEMEYGALRYTSSMIVREVARDQREDLYLTMNINKIDLPSILQAEFTKALQSKKDFRVAIDGSSADAEMLLIVNQYGLITPPLGSLTPVLNVRRKSPHTGWACRVAKNRLCHTPQRGKSRRERAREIS